MKKISFKIYTLGCKVNQYDSGRLASKLCGYGYVQAKDKADLVIINTCAVTFAAIAKDRHMISKAKKESPQAIVVVCGCWPKTYDIKCRDISADYIYSNRDQNKLVKNINLLYKNSKSKIRTSTANIALTDRARYFLKIQDGCRQFCSYCIIPYARGPLKSRGEREIINEVRSAVAAGYKEIVLTGIHLGLYGKDKGSKINLVMLLKKLINIHGLGRIRLSSIELNEVTTELIDLIAADKRMCRHLHIPLQSGSDKILRLMNRPYTTKIFLNKIKQIRKTIPNIGITTDVIVGFPGETGKEFKMTVSLIRQARFSRLHIFPYSEHDKTPSAIFPDKVQQSIIKKRAQALRLTGDKLEKSFRRKFINRKVELVIEGQTSNMVFGKTSEYIEVMAASDYQANRVKDLITLKMLDRFNKI